MYLMQIQNPGTYGFTYAVITQCIMSFFETRMCYLYAYNNQSVISKKVVHAINGTPRCRNVVRRSIIWLVAISAVTNSAPYVAVSTVLCRLLYHSIGVLFIKYKTPVTARPVTIF
jgi:hypothetical protein